MSECCHRLFCETVRAKGSALVLGLDPRQALMPRAYREQGAYRAQGLDGITAFHARLIEVLEPFIVGIKPQIAFFECLGTEGFSIYADTCHLGHAAGLVVIGDVKRGDIGSTAEAYARAHFAWADALTINPYLGDDSVEPFLEACRNEGKAVFVLALSSNPGWKRFQALKDGQGRPLYRAVAEAIHEWNVSCRDPDELYGPVGAVVGATQGERIQELREILKNSWLLLPGVGAQGAKISELTHAFDKDGHGALLPVSRGLAACFDPDDPDWEACVVSRAQELVGEMRAAVPALKKGLV